MRERTTEESEGRGELVMRVFSFILHGIHQKTSMAQDD